MLAGKNVLKRQLSCFKCRCVHSRHFSQAAEQPNADLSYNLETRLSSLPAKKPQREPFTKNLFIGKFDVEFLTFPELQNKEREREFFQWLEPIQNYVMHSVDNKDIDAKAILPTEIIEQLTKFGVFGARLEERFKALGLNFTEYSRLLEVIGSNPSLCSYVSSRETGPIDILLRYATEAQKAEYSPRILAGELVPTICLTENTKTSDVAVINMKASISECGNFWKLNGEKIMVANGGNANFFIVFVQCLESGDSFNTQDKTTALIVERKHGGISNSPPIDKLGQHGLETCTVTFKDTLIPKGNVLGHIGKAAEILMHLFGDSRHNVGAQATTTLKRFLKALTNHVIHGKHFNKQMHEFEATQKIVGEMTCALYAMESMTYLTTGMLDQYENQDCTMESAMVEAYSARECVAQIYKGLQLFGAQSYLKENPHSRVFRDALALTLFDGSNLDMNMLIALLGVQHAGQHHSDYVRKHRNPLMFPSFMLREILKRRKKLNLGLNEYLHPSLNDAALYIEFSVGDLQHAAQMMLGRHGSAIAERQMELYRLAEMATDIYAMVAAVARSSRSYCIGLANSDKEILLALTICNDNYRKVQLKMEEIEKGELGTCDDQYKRISDSVFKNGGYFAEHPLTKNF